jgi:uncharacterized protein YjdB
VFLLALFAGSVWTTGCSGGVTASTTPAAPAPPTQSSSAMLTVTPSTVSVATVVGNTSSQTVTATNVSAGSVAINQVTVTGAGFTTTGLTVPANLAAGASQTFEVAFAATTPGTVTGQLSIMTSASSDPVVVQLSATSTSPSSTPTPPAAVVDSVSVSPTSASVAAGGAVSFTALVQGTTTNTAVTWTASLGAITSAGVYTAPASAGSATITATSVADSTKSASATVTISAAPVPTPGVSSVSVSPTSASVIAGGTLQLTATVGGSPSANAVTWTTSSGTISTAGLFTAPATSGTATITATSVADTTKTATATITIAAPVVNSVTVSPSTASVITSGTLQLTASVQGTVTNKSVTWNASSGSISSAGLFTASATAGTATITATSAADATKTATATITVAAPVVNSVSVTPATVSASTGGTLQFSASVQGTVSNKSVAWTAILGAITSSGAYTAPASAGTDTVTATSNADASKFASATVTVAVPPPPPPGPLAAFPGARGGGAAAVGGRGGQVIEVTNLNDSGAGSLRACATASGARTCVFRVAGIIHPASVMIIHSSNLTIAGQTAPGGGIILAGDKMTNGPVFFITANDVVIRYLTCSIGNGSGHAPGPSAGAGCFELASGNNQHNVVFDHLTMRWWDDKPYLMLSNGGFSPITNTVMQWSLFYEPNSGHQVGPMTDDTGGFASGDTGDDFHHNMFVNIGHRLPLYNTKSGRWVNNIVFNWDFYALLAQGGVKIDIINNKYVAGNLNATNDTHEFDFNNSQSSDDPAASMPGPPSAYISGNVGPHQSDPSGDQTKMTSQGNEGGDTGSAVPSSWFRSSPMSAQAIPIVADPESNLDSVMLPTVGNSQGIDCNGNWVNRRDSVDVRIITQYQNNTSGGYFTTADSTHSNPSVAAGTACTESLHDGIPDQWKSAQGLSTTDPNLYKTLAPSGYTYLENYLNGPQ